MALVVSHHFALFFTRPLSVCYSRSLLRKRKDKRRINDGPLRINFVRYIFCRACGTTFYHISTDTHDPSISQTQYKIVINTIITDTFLNHHIFIFKRQSSSIEERIYKKNVL